MRPIRLLTIMQVKFVKPALTVVAQPTYDLGRTVVELLLQRMEKPGRPRQAVVLAPTLHIRESSLQRVAVVTA